MITTTRPAPAQSDAELQRRFTDFLASDAGRRLIEALGPQARPNRRTITQALDLLSDEERAEYGETEAKQQQNFTTAVEATRDWTQQRTQQQTQQRTQQRTAQRGTKRDKGGPSFGG